MVLHLAFSVECGIIGTNEMNASLAHRKHKRKHPELQLRVLFCAGKICTQGIFIRICKCLPTTFANGWIDTCDDSSLK